MKISVSIDVPDLEAGTTFYVSALGCTRLRAQGKDMVVLSAGNADIYLMQRSVASNPASAASADLERTYERHWTPVHLDFLTDDVDGSVARIVLAGGVHEGGEEGDWGAIAHCSDPFGNGFCVIRE